jgi:hypothetical protein
MRSSHTPHLDSSQIGILIAVELGLAVLAFLLAFGLASGIRAMAKSTAGFGALRIARIWLPLLSGYGAIAFAASFGEAHRDPNVSWMVWLLAFLVGAAAGGGVQLVYSRMSPAPSANATGASALWIFAHRILAPQFHSDPGQFIATLDGARAPRFLEWAWREATGGAPGMSGPPLQYGIDRPRPDLTVIWFRFAHVTRTGEPHSARFLVRTPGPGLGPGYARAFYLEHSEQLSAPGRAAALVCESAAGGAHLNLATILPAEDEAGFDRVIMDHVTKSAMPRAATIAA